MIYYVSDTHFAHANIIEYCARPFETVEAMNDRMWTAIRAVDAAGHQLVHGGDLCYGRGKDAWLATMPELSGRDQHVIVLGNHDHGMKGEKRTPVRAQYERWFGRIVGDRKAWRENTLVVDDTLHGRPVRVLVSHRPQDDLRGCDFNLYGHVHNNLLTGWSPAAHDSYEARTGREDEDQWVLGSERHFNICVEILGYEPRPLFGVIQRNRLQKGSLRS